MSRRSPSREAKELYAIRLHEDDLARKQGEAQIAGAHCRLAAEHSHQLMVGLDTGSAGTARTICRIAKGDRACR